MEFLIITLLLLLNGIFAMYEMALVSSSRTRLENSARLGNTGAAKTLRLLENPEEILSTIQVGITLIGIVSGAFGGVRIARELHPFFARFGLTASHAEAISMIIVIGLITYFSLVIGELVPKSLALNHPEKIAVRLTPFMSLLSKLAYPFVWILSISTRGLNRLLGIRKNDERSMTEDEIKIILRESSVSGVIEKQESEMIRDVFRFTDKRANELMTHRRDVVSLYTDWGKEQVLETIREANFSRYLLYEEPGEKLVGIVSVKDIIGLWIDNRPFDLRAIATTPIYVPETMLGNALLELFKNRKASFAVVVSEYGVIQGIITLHDISESILGEIPEEKDDELSTIVRREDGTFLVDGSYNAIDFMEEMGVALSEEFPHGDFNTLGGLAMFILDRIPTEGDKFSYNDLDFEVVDMDGSRVDKLLVTIKI